jgi:hypothetical protein
MERGKKRGKARAPDQVPVSSAQLCRIHGPPQVLALIVSLLRDFMPCRVPARAIAPGGGSNQGQRSGGGLCSVLCVEIDRAA